MTDRRTFSIGGASSRRLPAPGDGLAVPARYDRARDDRREEERVRDVSFQDFVTHADYWIGIVCVLCAALMFSDNGFILAVIFFAGLAGSGWLFFLGLLTGILYNTANGDGLRSFLNDAGMPAQAAGLMPSEVGQNLPSVTRGVGVAGWVLLGWFLVEAVLIILGIYFTGWIQYLLGLIAFVWAAAGLIRGLGVTAASNAMQARMRAKAEDQIAHGLAGAKIQNDPHKARKMKVAAEATAKKHRQLLMLTVTDISLSAFLAIACVILDSPVPWSGPVVVSAYLCSGFWLIILGRVTGHGRPGHHTHPDDHAQEEFDKSVIERKSVAELLEQARKEREGGA